MTDHINDVERVFMAFADKTRLQLLYLLRDGEVSVNSLCEALQTSQPKVSRHLAYLRTMDMVSTRRDGKSIYYKLDLPSDPFGASVVEGTIEWLDSFSGSPGRRKRANPVRPVVTEPPLEEPTLVDDGPQQRDQAFKPEPEPIDDEMEVYLL